MLTAVASGEDAGSRIDVFMTRRLPDMSRSQAQRLIRDGRVQLNAAAQSKTSGLVATGDTVRVSVPPPADGAPAAETIPLTVLYDDADIAVVDKPAGMVVHPAAGHAQGTLVNALLHHVGGLSGIGGVARPGIVHRLDRGTSGVMIIAKHDRAHRELARQFHDREVTKAYVALVWGALAPGAVIDRSIGRDPRNRKKMSSRAARGRTAITRVDAVTRLGPVSLVTLTIGTGRTHQIRVHLSETGHPVVGDDVYGGARRRLPAGLAMLGRLTRPFLHARQLTVTHPSSGDRMTFDAPLPQDLEEILQRLSRPVPQ